MSPSRPFALLFALCFGFSVAAPVLAAPSEAEKRRKLREKLGLPEPEKKPPEDKPEDGGEKDGDDVEDEVDEPEEGGGPPTEGGTPEEKKPRVTYSGRIHKMVQSDCGGCHKKGSSAGSTRLSLTGEIDADYKAVRGLVKPSSPASSTLLLKASGKGHGGGTPWPDASAKQKRVLAWIEAGAPKGGGKSADPPVAVAPVTPAPVDKPGPAAKPKEPTTAPAPPTKPPPEQAREAPVDPFIAVQAILDAKCSGCHGEGKTAAGTKYKIASDLETNRTTVRSLIDLNDPPSSLLLTKASGQQHGGGAIMPTTDPDHAVVLEWIAGGAANPSALAPIDVVTGASKPKKRENRLGDGTPLPQAKYPSHLPFSLPASLRINGRFDFSYERRGVKNHPFSKDGYNALATYHHFLFISRSGAKDPFGFNVELITQQFYEFNARFKPKRADVQLLWKAGKILVPFGEEPLFHSSYGGRTGFDQELLPVVWAVPGIAFTVQGRAGPVTLSNDLYTIQGHGLRSEDAVLNLQTDIAPLDHVKVATGDRFGVSWGPLTGWYSFQFTPLGYSRLLFMQAIDLEFWKMPGVKVVENLALGAGAMRADVTGGDTASNGGDYYHFGSYAYARYDFLPQLSLQYRAGLKTYDNRRGVFFDDTRIDERDRGSHNITLTGRYMGFYAVMQFFWNLEKANEQNDDFLRLTVGYEF